MHSHALIFIQDLAIIMLVAGLMTILCHRFKQPIVFGYIVAGILIGPHTPPFSLITDLKTINTLAEIGVIFLMFSLGLEFNLPKLSKVGFTAVVGAASEILLMTWVGYEIGLMFDWPQIDAIFLGALLSISSTTIIIKALDELKLKKEKFAQLIFGILIVEDIFAILILALLSSIAISGSLDFKDIVYTTTKLCSFLVVSLLIGILFVPRLLGYIGKFKSREMLLITALGLCFGFCLLVVKLEYSVALGAFIMGAIIAESKQLKIIEHLVVPLRDTFSAVFFVSVGLLFNPKILVEHGYAIAILTFIVIFGKIVSCALGVFVTGHNGKTSIRVGMGLAQIGEFSFIIASLGIALNVTDDFLYSIAVAISIITTVSTPYLIKYSDAVTDKISVLIPSKIIKFLSSYSLWLRKIQPGVHQVTITNYIKKSMLHIFLNLFVITAIFLGGAYIAKSHLGILLLKSTNITLQKTIIFAATLLLSLPFIVAFYRKIKGISMILAEISTGENTNNSLKQNLRKIIGEIIPVVSLIGMMVFLFLLSARILPPIGMLLIVLFSIVMLSIFLLPWFIKLHSKLQITIMESMKTEDSSDDIKTNKD